MLPNFFQDGETDAGLAKQFPIGEIPLRRKPDSDKIAQFDDNMRVNKKVISISNNFILSFPMFIFHTLVISKICSRNLLLT